MHGFPQLWIWVAFEVSWHWTADQGPACLHTDYSPILLSRFLADLKKEFSGQFNWIWLRLWKLCWYSSLLSPGSKVLVKTVDVGIYLLGKLLVFGKPKWEELYLKCPEGSFHLKFPPVRLPAPTEVFGAQGCFSEKAANLRPASLSCHWRLQQGRFPVGCPWTGKGFCQDNVRTRTMSALPPLAHFSQ